MCHDSGMVPMLPPEGRIAIVMYRRTPLATSRAATVICSLARPRRRLVGKQPPVFHIPQQASPDGDETWKDKLRASQLTRRLLRLRGRNAEAIEGGFHVLRADTLDMRPTCAMCGKVSSAGTWARLAALPCASGCDRAEVVEEQGARIEVLLADLACTLSGPAASRPKLRQDLREEAQHELRLQIELANARGSLFHEFCLSGDLLVSCKRCRRAKPSPRFVAWRDEPCPAAEQISPTVQLSTRGAAISQARALGFISKLADANTRTGHFHTFLLEGAHVACTACGKRRMKAVLQRWINEACVARLPAVDLAETVSPARSRGDVGVCQHDRGGSRRKLAQAQEKLDRLNARPGGFHQFRFTEAGDQVECTTCGKRRARAVLSRWAQEPCTTASTRDPFSVPV